MISRTRTVFLAISIVCAYIVWGALISLQPPFYPTEAEKKGATPAQVNDWHISHFIYADKEFDFHFNSNVELIFSNKFQFFDFL